MNPSSIDPYQVAIGCVKADPYRIGRAYGLQGPEMQLVKKALRLGRKHKTRREDLLEIISTAKRILEMDAEDQAQIRNQDENECPCCFNLRMVPSIESGSDVMNTPCPICNGGAVEPQEQS